MHAEVLTLPQWIDRCALRLGTLLPAMDTAEVARRAAAIAGDAYLLQPEQAAEVYLELPDMPAEALCDHEKFEFSTWTLGHVFDDDSASSGLAREAAASVFEAEGVDPVAGMLAQFKLECWDDAGSPDDMKLSEEEHKAQRSWVLASLAADAAGPTAPGQPRGRLAMQWPSKLRWEAARERWLDRQSVNA